MSSPGGILGTILAHKREEVALARRLAPDLQSAIAAASSVRPFREALAAGEGPGIIAECKRASPSRGPIWEGPWDPAWLATRYAEGGARCLSVLTDTRFFWGPLTDLGRAREASGRPVIRKDFMIDPWQLDEARAASADAILLIVSAMDGVGQLTDLLGHARSLGLDALVEVHDADEARTAIDAGADLVGVNNRDLKTFEVDLANTEALAPALLEAGALVVAESGIHTAADVERLAAAGARGMLVGESLVRADDPAGHLAALLGESS